MKQIPMTTREAAKNLCQEAAAACDNRFMIGGVLSESVKAMCESYNFKLSDFFDNVPSGK